MKVVEKYISIIILIVLVSSCEKIEGNYTQYLDREKVYSPKIINLRGYSSLKEVSLAWDNPVGTIAKKVIIDYQDSTITTSEMIDSITITGLEIKGYIISVYTADAFDNKSVPETISLFPNGEE